MVLKQVFQVLKVHPHLEHALGLKNHSILLHPMLYDPYAMVSSTTVLPNVTDHHLNKTIIQIEPFVAVFQCLLLLVPMVTCAGNGLVIASIAMERSLQTVTNYFIFSLSLSDSMVAVLVMPIAVIVEVNNGKWYWGKSFCNAFIMTDIFASTASILNMTAISIDRFIAVRFPLVYSRRVKLAQKRTFFIIVLVWSISLITALPIAFGVNKLNDNISECFFNNADYNLFSSLVSFYMPASLMLTLYLMIFRITQRQALAKKSIALIGPAAKERKTALTGMTNSLKRRFTNAGRTAAGAVNHDNSSSTNKGSRRCSEIDAVVDLVLFDNLNLAIRTFMAHEAQSNSLTNEMNQKRAELTRAPLVPTKRDIPQSTSSLSMNRVRHRNNSLVIVNHHTEKAELEDPNRIVEIDKSLRISSLDSVVRGRARSCSLIPESSCKHHPNSDLQTIEEVTSPIISANDHRKNYQSIARVDVCGTEPPSYPPKAKSERSRWSTDAHRKATLTLQGKVNDLQISTKRKDAREKRITRTLAIVVGVFVVCWTPFFTCHVIEAICTKNDKHCIAQRAFFWTTWLGYLNSCMNPIIYTTFNQEFRKSFIKMFRLAQNRCLQC